MERRSRSAPGSGSSRGRRIPKPESDGSSGRATSRRRSTKRTGTATPSMRERTCSSSTWRPARRSSSQTVTSRIARSRGRRMDARSLFPGRAAARVITRRRTFGWPTSRPARRFVSRRTLDGPSRRPGLRTGPRSPVTARTRRTPGSAIRWCACGPCPRVAGSRDDSPNATTAAPSFCRRRRSRRGRSGQPITRA